jgi:hypothetical protein
MLVVPMAVVIVVPTEVVIVVPMEVIQRALLLIRLHL